MTKLIPEPKYDPTAGKRVIIALLDGAGVGALPDAIDYGDAGANTLGHVFQKHGPLKTGNLFRLGLGSILRLSGFDPGPDQDHEPGYCGRLSPLSPGKDTTSGHWELSGVVLKYPFPVYPHGFPIEVITAFEEAIGRQVLGNIAASGTEIIETMGEAHLSGGSPIVYTSADSVFQIAAHEAVTKPDELYRWCLIARQILQGKHAVGRVIARPFTGQPGSFKRTHGRRDFALAPPGPTLLDRAAAAGYTAAVVGKVADIFNHRGITAYRPGGDNEAVAESLLSLIREVEQGVIWATFGDFDTLYGHRNDSAGFAAALEHIDRFIGRLMAEAAPEDLLLITADHGCDPTHPGSDHTREYVPLFAWSPQFHAPVGLGTRNSLADLGAGAAKWLNLPPLGQGSSFL
ncbi:MAG: phosphopentomutase [Bacillota bacterium]